MSAIENQEKIILIIAKDVFVDVSGGKTATINEDGSVEIRNLK